MEGIWKARRHSALSHDGVDDKVDVTNDASFQFGTGNFTIELWLRRRDINRAQDFIQTHAGSYYTQGWRTLVAAGNQWFFQMGDGTNGLSLASGLNIADFSWHHFAIIVARPTVRMFMDLQEGLSGDASSVGSVSNTNPLVIGYGANGWLKGVVSMVRLYNRALSESEIKYLYYNPDDPLDTDHLVLWLHPGSIDTDAGYWWDISGRDNHGQIFGATKVSLVSPEVTVL